MGTTTRNILFSFGKEHRGFREEWSPHRGVSDFWEIQGVFHETNIKQAVYSFRMSVRRIAAGLESFQSVSIYLYDMLHNRSFGDRWNMHSVKGEKEQLFIDDESILFGNRAQLLYNEDDAFAFRMRGSKFGLDLRIDPTHPEVWYGADGRMHCTTAENRLNFMYNCTLPQLKCIGRLYMDEDSMHVSGNASFERYWGVFPIRMAKSHWEHFYIFFNNGDEMALSDFPYGKYSTGMCFPADGDAFVLNEYESSAIDFTEVDDWRFASGWQLSLPQYKQEKLYLVPDMKDQFQLPISRPVLGIYDKDGVRQGFALGELFPGARNELNKIGLHIYYE